MTSKVLRDDIVTNASRYLSALRAERVGPAAGSLRFLLLELPGLGALSSVREANNRAGLERSDFAVRRVPLIFARK